MALSSTLVVVLLVQSAFWSAIRRSRYAPFAPSELRAAMPRADAHNCFLWVGAELGVVGLALFLWLLGAALRRGWAHR